MRTTILALLLVALPAAAIADSKAAEQHFNKGELAYRKGQFIAAAKHFEAAYAELPAPEIAYSAAQAYRLGYQADPDPAHVRRAIELYEGYLRASADGPRVKDASAHLDALKKEWRDLVTAGKAQDDRIAADKTQIGVAVPAAVKGATVRIDGADVSGKDYVDVEPGNRVVRVEAPGYAPYEEKVPVARGAQILVRAALEPRPARVKLATESGVAVHVDGREVRLRDGVFQAAPGKRHVTVTRRGRRPFARELELSPGATVEVKADLHQTDQRRIAKFVLISSGVLLGLTATTTTIAFVADSKATGAAADGIDDDGDADTYNRWRDRRNTMRDTSLLLGGATVLAGVAAAGLYLFDNPPAETPLPAGTDTDTRFAPMVWSDGAGLGIEGSW